MGTNRLKKGLFSRSLYLWVQQHHHDNQFGVHRCPYSKVPALGQL